MSQGKTRKGLREEAKRAMWIYYRDHKAWLPEWIREYREEIIERIQAGKTAESVFNEIIDREQKALVAPTGT